PEAPAPLHTNIDMDLQRFAHDYFGDSLTGAMVALEPQTGKVIALYSAPSYDINKFIGGVSTEYYTSLQEDPRRPMYNKATQGIYPPASTWKLATAAIGLEKKLVTMDSHMDRPCTGGYTYGGRFYKCWDHNGHGDITLAQAIAQSCDVYFYQLGLKIGLLDLVAGGVKLGFYGKTGIDLPEEKQAIFPEGPKYFDKKYGPRGWTTSSGMILNMSIGQGDNAQTPLNMAKFYTALATDGKASTPRIVDTAAVRTDAISLDAAQMKGLQDALSDVLTRGTGARAQIKGLTIAGKTGTAQNAGPDHAWFVGYAPVDDPKIVVAVLLEHGLHGSAAAKIATKMMERYLKAKLTLTSITPDG
ncbi:MAG: penicillin-binding transpeptidase domain-containing protein, partial [Gemmatimonadaceae bacterium]